MSLFNEVLDLSKIESGSLEVELENVCLDEVITESISLVKTQAALKNITITDFISGNNYCVEADPKRLKQVIVNLLSNAEKYNKKNGAISLVSEIIENKYLRIKVNDTGKGISKSDIAKLFVPFQRLNVKNYVDGVGIGLAVTKNLVELMCGSIGVESVPGKGSTFWVQFALVKKVN